MLYRVLFSVFPTRMLGLAILAVVLLQLAGVDLLGMVMTELSNALDLSSWFDFGSFDLLPQGDWL